MARIRKSPWVVWAGGFGFLVASLIVGSLQVASAGPSVSGAVTANQGSAGGSPWPVSGTVGVNNFPNTQSVSGTVGVSSLPPLSSGTNNIGSVGLSGSLPSGTNNVGNVGIESGQSIGLAAGTNDIGTVHVAAPTPATAFSLCGVADGHSNCASSLTGLATGTIVNTLSVRCEVAPGQRAGAEFFNSNEYDIALSFEGNFSGVDVYTGTLTNLGIPIQDGGSWLNTFEDYTASSGNGAICTLFYVTTS